MAGRRDTINNAVNGPGGIVGTAAKEGEILGKFSNGLSSGVGLIDAMKAIGDRITNTRNATEAIDNVLTIDAMNFRSNHLR